MGNCAGAILPGFHQIEFQEFAQPLADFAIGHAGLPFQHPRGIAGVEFDESQRGCAVRAKPARLFAGVAGEFTGRRRVAVRVEK